MNNFKVYLVLLVALIIAISCEKKPHPSFTTNKDLYQGGDTIKLTNTSVSGSTFEWSFPNGEIVNTENAVYVVDANTTFTTYNFGLTVKSKGHCKRESISKTIKIIPQSYFKRFNIVNSSNEEYKTIPFTLEYLQDQNVVTASRYNDNTKESEYYDIYFPSGNLPQAGVYNLQANTINLSAFTANVTFAVIPNESQFPISPKKFDTGQINVEYINNTMHIYFTNIASTPTNFLLDGNVYVPL